MSKRIGVTASEMRAMREEGMSNRDIANVLDISLPTVLKYIGRQDGRMESFDAFKDKPKKKETETNEEVRIPEYEPKAFREWYEVCGFNFEINHNAQKLVIEFGTEVICIPYEKIPDLVQFLVWAMRTRMEVTADAEDKLKAEGCEI